MLRLLAKHLRERGKLNLDEAFVDATFASAKKGASPSVRPGAARAPRSSLSPLATVFLSPSLSKALHLPSAELVEAVLAECFLDELPERLIGDKAYDSDVLDQTLAEEYGVEMISPNRSNRNARARTADRCVAIDADGRSRAIFAWMQNYRRLVTRWEYHIENFLGFVQLACLLMLIRHL